MYELFFMLIDISLIRTHTTSHNQFTINQMPETQIATALKFSSINLICQHNLQLSSFPPGFAYKSLLQNKEILISINEVNYRHFAFT